MAAQGGDTDITDLIHTHLPNTESKTGEGCTPLMAAALCGKLHAVKWFLEKGATVTSATDGIYYILQHEVVTLIPLILSLLTCRTLSQKQLMVKHLLSLLFVMASCRV